MSSCIPALTFSQVGASESVEVEDGIAPGHILSQPSEHDGNGIDVDGAVHVTHETEQKIPVPLEHVLHGVYRQNIGVNHDKFSCHAITSL